MPDTNLFKKFQKQFKSQSILLQFQQSMQPEKDHHFPLPHPPLHLSLPVPQLLPHPPLCRTFAPSVFPSQYFPVLLFPLPQTLAMNFLKPRSSLSFLETSVFHSMSIYCFVFLAWDLQIISALAFARALFVSKGLQAALALAQGAQDFA